LTSGVAALMAVMAGGEVIRCQITPTMSVERIYNILDRERQHCLKGKP
jgi:hypothetical protein